MLISKAVKHAKSFASSRSANSDLIDQMILSLRNTMFLKPDQAAAFAGEFSRKFLLSNPVGQKAAGVSAVSRVDGPIEFSLLRHSRAGTRNGRRTVSAYGIPKPADYIRELYFALTGILLCRAFLLRSFGRDFCRGLGFSPPNRHLRRYCARCLPFV